MLAHRHVDRRLDEAGLYGRGGDKTGQDRTQHEGYVSIAQLHGQRYALSICMSVCLCVRACVTSHSKPF